MQYGLELLILLPKDIDKNKEEILNQLPIGIILFDNNGIIQFVNRTVHEFEILYPNLLVQSLIGRNIFSQEIINKQSLFKHFEDLKNGFSFELELEEITIPGKSHIKLILKGTPIFEDDNFSGGALIIEDLKVIHRTQKQFLLRQDFLTNATEFITDLFIVIDSNFLIKFISGNTSLLFSNSTSYEGSSIFSGVDNETVSALDELIANVKKSKTHSTSTIKIKHDDNYKLIEVKFLPQLDNKKEVNFIYLSFRELSSSELKISQTKNESFRTELYSKLNDSAGMALFVIDNTDKITWWNENFETIFGYKKSEIENVKVGSIIIELDKTRLEKIRNVLTSETSHRVFINHKKDEDKFLELIFTLDEDAERNLNVLCTDITKLIRTENQLNSIIKNIAQLSEDAEYFFCRTDETGNIIDVNNKFCEVFNYTAEELRQKRIYELIDQNYFESNIFDLRTATDELPLKIILPFKSSGNKLFNLNLIVFPAIESSNSIQFDCYLRYSESHSAKTKEAELFHSILAASNDGICTGYDGKIIFANTAFAEIFNFSSGEELKDKDILDLVSSEDTLKVAEYFRMLERNKAIAPTRFNFLGKKNDGSEFYAEISSGTFSFDEKVYTVMVIRDVSERIRAQKAIRESEEKYRNITENIDDFLFTFERLKTTLRPVFCTASVQKITGYTQSDFLTDAKLFFKIIHPDDFQIFKPKLINLLKSRIQNSGEFEFRIINKHGNIVWVRTKLNLVRIGAGKIQKIFGLVSDVTFRKRAEEELKKSTQNLIKLNETKDRFISIISHDLRTPFSSILGFTDLLINDKDLSDDEKRQYIQYIQESSHSMLALVNSLLDWTRLQTGRIKFDPQKLNIAQVINDSLKTLSGISIQKGIEVVNLIKEEKLVFADKSLIIQVFNNLISNAVKFTTTGGYIYISCSLSANPRFIEFSVKDTGVGIKEENLKKLFSIESKFTSEGTAGEKGSGLGLSLVKEIIERHGGSITVSSKFGEGTDFRFTLPVASAKILLVDDNKTDRLLYTKILKNITPDYEIDIASNGKEALEKIQSSHPALVITDHSMPVMNGYEFVIELQKLEMKGKPPVIVLSSDIDRNAINDYNGIGIEYVFHKPVNLGHFKQAVEKSLMKSFSST